MAVEFAEDALPVPLELVIAAGAEDVENDSTETGLSEMSLHKGLVCFLSGLAVADVHEERTPGPSELAGKRHKVPAGGMPPPGHSE